MVMVMVIGPQEVSQCLTTQDSFTAKILSRCTAVLLGFIQAKWEDGSARKFTDGDRRYGEGNHAHRKEPR